MTPTGLQQPSETLGNTAETDSAVSPAVLFDAETAELQRLIDAWPSLDDAIKARIMELMNTAVQS